MELYLIRHPHTLNNQKDKLTGWQNTNYTKKGENQYKKILKFFNGNKKEIYSSDLKRCLKLGKAISKQNQSKLIITDLLREQNFKKTKPHDKYETQSQFEKRISNFLKKTKIKNKIIVSHAGAIKEIIRNFLEYGEEQLKKYISLPRDRIFLIETNKKGNKLKIIRV